MRESFANPTVWLLGLAFAAAPATMLVAALRPRLAWPVAALAAVVAFAAALWGWLGDPAPVDAAWAPEWGLRFAFELDGLGALYSLLATGIGAAAVIYAGAYVPRHLHHQHRPATEAGLLYALLLLFMGAMVGLVTAQDLILIFLFWDLTAITSYFLIAYDRQLDESRSAAMMALLITGVTAVLLLIGILMLYGRYGTFSLPVLIPLVEPGDHLLWAGALMLVGALAKSAQVPLHFWLPRAMAAPTPVSAYLHSAAMVAAGVFLVGRLYPILAIEQRLIDGLLVVGLLSMAVGGVIALTRDELKQLLAYSTIAQYGYVVAMLGFGGPYGAAGASFYVVAHALAKSALFFTAGAVMEATGRRHLGVLGGLVRSMPLLAAGSGAAAASLAALPLTVGFFKDELFFAAALQRSDAFAVVAVAGAALTLAYAWRFWAGIFLGAERTTPEPIPVRLVAPVVVLGGLGIAFGIAVGPVADLAEAAGRATFGGETPIQPAYHLDTRAENVMALATFALGGILIATRSAWIAAFDAVARTGARVGPERAYRLSLQKLDTLSDRAHRIEVRDLRSRVATVLVPTAILVGAAVLVQFTFDDFTVGTLRRADFPLVLVLALAAASAVTATMAGDHLTMALIVSGVGFSLAVFFAFFGAPNVALVAVLIETIFSLLFIGMLILLPPQAARFVVATRGFAQRQVRDAVVGVLAGFFAFVVAWSVLSRPAAQDSVSATLTTLTPSAHGSDVVTVILADFRGLDTMGEITVILIGLVGLATMLRRGHLR